MAAFTVLLLLIATAVGTSQGGVFLHSEILNRRLANNSFISSNNIGDVDGAIICGRESGNQPSAAEWLNSAGQQVQEGYSSISGNLVVYKQLRSDGIHLFRGGVEFSTQHEGVYACHIDDDDGNSQVLFIGIYTPATLQNSGPPVLESPVFSLITPRTTNSSKFTLACPSSSFPPTSTVWLRDGQPLTAGGDQFHTWQVLVDPSTSGYSNVLRVSGNLAGNYQCRVGNSEGNATASRTVQVPSGPPTNVRAEPGGGGSVRVTWTQPSGKVSGYVIVYGPTNAPPTETPSPVNVEDPAAIDYTIEDIAPEIEFTIEMWAYLDLPSSSSNPTTIYLDVPDQPTSVMATTTPIGTLVVQWEGPQSQADVEGYIVRYSPTASLCEGIPGGEMVVNGSQTTQLEISGMAAGAEYNVSVAAFNSIGTGSFSTPPFRVMIPAKAPEGEPLDVLVIAVPPDALSVSWGPPNCQSWNSRLITGYTIHYTPLTSSQQQQQEEEEEEVGEGLQYELTGLDSFTDYSVRVSASNGQGRGPPSHPVTVSLVTAPGPLQSVEYKPDILSVLLKWDPPLRGRGYITMVMLEYSSGAMKLGTVNVTKTESDLMEANARYRLGGLRYMSTYNVSLTPHTADPTPGPTHHLTVSTNSIGSVELVEVRVFNTSAVNVSWTPLASIHITSYRVYYAKVTEDDEEEEGADSSSEVSVVFPVERSLGGGRGRRKESGEGWGLVGGLEEGVEYGFSVAAEVVVPDGGERLEGVRTQPVTVTIEDTSASSGDGGFNAVIIISAVASGLLLVLIAVGLILIIVTACLFRRYRRSGKMEVACSMELRPNPKPVPQMVGTYDPPSNDLASCRPEIVDAPTDMIAVEGERVDFRLKVLGSPEPTVVWYHNGCMVGPDYATEISNDGGLTLVSVEPNHEGTYRYTVSNSVGSIQGKVTLYVSSEMSGWGRQQQGQRRMDLPTVTSALVTVEQFPQFVREKSENGSKGLRDQFLCLSSCEENHFTSVALSNENKKFNRFTNIIPYDDNRVKLKPLNGREDCQHDYINASYIDGYGIARKFVATQGPTDTTVVDFWRMVWQLHSPTVVMMTNLEEGRKKCEQYWPNFGTADYGPYSVTLAEQKIRANYTIRKLTLTSTFSTRRVHYVNHYQFTSWRDHQVPDSTFPLLEFHRRLTGRHRPNKGPIIIHCSAGVGRSGAFVLLDMALGQAAGEKRMDIPNILTRLRSQRMKMVQTPEQYIFVHKAVLEKLTYSPTHIEVAQLEPTIAELEAHNPRLGCSLLEEQFVRLQKLSPGVQDNSTCRMALQNPHKNRSRDHLPTDQWRVPLKDERADYIHASFAGDHRQKEAFIIAQAPLQETCRDFWKMVHERECCAIVMLSGQVEEGRVICQRYWPITEVELYGEYAVTPLGEQEHDLYYERAFSVTDTKTGQVHYVSQFKVFGWTSDGKTTNPAAIVDCMLSVEGIQRRSGNNPIVVHCSDGVTRTGIFCVAMAVIDSCQLEETVDVFLAVRALRQQRPGAIPLLQHYRLIHKLLLTFHQTNYSNSSC